MVGVGDSLYTLAIAIILIFNEIVDLTSFYTSNVTYVNSVTLVTLVTHVTSVIHVISVTHVTFVPLLHIC